MGPRSEDRGDLPNNRRWKTVSTLQWGRGPKTAETALPTLVTQGVEMLQWGRGPKTAETALEKIPVVLVRCNGLFEHLSGREPTPLRSRMLV